MNRVARGLVAVLLAFGLLAVVAWAAPPVPSFTFSPQDPLVGERMTFTNTSTDRDDDIEDIDWDLDNDGSFDDGDDETETWTFTTPGPKRVRLRVDDDDQSRTTFRDFTVRPNEAPVANFTVNPESPLTNQQLTATSTSTDPEGRPLTIGWDTNDNNVYGDASGPQLTLPGFPDNGPRVIGIQVTDSGGTVRTLRRTITIRNRVPVASFNVSDDDVDTLVPIQFTSTSNDPDGTVNRTEWDVDGDGQFDDATGSSINRSFSDNGTFNVRVRVTDDDGDSAVSGVRPVTVRNRLPVAAFDLSVAEIDTGDPVQLISRSSDPDGQVRSTEWDLDGDNQYDDASGNEITHSFTEDGEQSVAMRVTDDDGASATTARQVTVRNRRPNASFTYSPNAPFTGDEVVLTSTSEDADGEIEEYRWDLDGDREFDDAEGSEVRTSFDQPGSYQVGLQVIDDDDRESEAFDTIDVAPRPDPAQPNPPGGGGAPGGGTGNAGRRALIPFPSIRIRGVTTATGARIDLLSVRTPGGTRILVRCRGGTCPYARRILRARFGESQARTLRLPGFRRRHVRAGTVIQIFVIDDGVIGKYTRFEIRRGVRPPRRIDRCAVPGRFRVRRCPA